jgi:hypothetical protein
MSTIQVYGRRLTALVLGTAHSHEGTVFSSAYESGEDDADADGVESIPKTVPFGDNGQARLISVRCHKHKEQKHNGLYLCLVPLPFPYTVLLLAQVSLCSNINALMPSVRLYGTQFLFLTLRGVTFSHTRCFIPKHFTIQYFTHFLAIRLSPHHRLVSSP